MADDIDDAEQEVTRMDGIENSWAGKVLVRLVRAVRQHHNRIQNLNQRVTALENRAAASQDEGPPN